MTDPPKNYQDFSGHLRAFVSTDFDKLSRQAADNASFIDDMVPNQKYYYTFRTIGATDLSNVDEMLEAVEEHGYYAGPVYTMHSFSNPTPVYEVELVDDDGAVYLLIGTVDFDILHPPPTHKTMKRLLHVKPTMTQSLPKFGTIDDLRWSDTAEDGRPISRVVHPGATALDAVEALSGTVPLGLENVSIWGKTFKIRLTSRETCRKLDLNVKLDTKYIRADECNQVSIVGVPYDADEEV